MKNRFTTTDIQAMIRELEPKLVGMRAANIYDIDKKTYLIKLAKPPNKAMLLLESGIRIHTTEYDWPKCEPPAPFAMKCRKHIRTRRLTGLSQVGTDRVICLTFGANETTYHLIVELYDKGNILLCDHQYVILSLLRPRSEGDSNVKFAVHERYPMELAHMADSVTIDGLRLAFEGAKAGDPLRKHLNPLLPCGPSVIEHALLTHGFPPNAKVGEGFNPETDFDRLRCVVDLCGTLVEEAAAVGKGYIILKDQKTSNGKALAKAAAAVAGSRVAADAVDGGAQAVPEQADDDTASFFDEFHPLLFKQHESAKHREFDSFDRAVDVFFSEMEAQKIEMRTIQKEQAALKKLENVKDDHARRLRGLKESQELNTERAELIELNITTVDKAIQVINSALASSMEWKAIEDMVAEAASRGDAVAATIAGLKLDRNTMTMRLTKPSESSSDSESYSDSDGASDGGAGAAVDEPLASQRKGAKVKARGKGGGRGKGKPRTTAVDIDLSLTAFANARALYDTKRSSAVKEKKTIEASEQALHNAEMKTTAALKQVQVQAKMQKSRKTYWFEKFLWFISSENFLVVGGRDRQQNEQIVRRYLTKGDIYVHADFHGATSCVIKNPSGGDVPPKTLSEAGGMAASFSSAWDAKIVSGAYWVRHDQVSKTAPTGEYLTAGAFMIRGKKNFLPPVPLVVGYGILFKVDESCIANHVGERAPRQLNHDDDTADRSRGTGREAKAAAPTTDDPNTDTIRAPDGPAAAIKANDGGDDEQTSADEVEGTADDTGRVQTEEDSDNDGDVGYPEASIRVNFSASKATVSVLTEKGSDDKEDGDQAERTESSGKAGAARSAKEKREARKQRRKDAGLAGPSEPEKSSSAPPRPPHEQSTAPAVPAVTRTASAGATPTQSKRGQRGKHAKIKTKYADQDEEDRELAMEILSSGKTEGKLSKREKRKQRKADGTMGSKHIKAIGAQGLDLPQEAIERMGEGMITKPFEKHVDWTEEEQTLALARKDETMRSKADAEEAEEIRRILESENIQTLDDSEREGITFLDALTGCPRSDDVITFAVPVCAPMSVVLAYKYRIKMTPGSTKKGKAANTALHNFLTTKDATSQEKDAMKSIKDNELSQNLPGKVKVMGAPARK